MSLLPQYTHIINPKLKHIYLSFDEEGTLIIKSPKVSQQRIEKLLLKKASWINRSRQKLENKKGRNPDFKTTAALYFLGESYPIHLIQHDTKRTKLIFDETSFILYYHSYDEKNFQKHIDHFYKEEAKHRIPSFVDRWSEKMKLSYNTVSFRKTKRQWGSCSAKNDLSFNTMMMKLPLGIIEYIIVHELAHIKHKHHQKAFWHLVEAYLPTYKQHVKELKHYRTL